MEVNLGSMQNYLRWLLGLAVVALAIYGNSYYSLEPLLYRVLGVVVLLTLSSVILITTTEGKEALKLILESRTEIRRVIWPTRAETTQTT
ncbi:MAG: preprotein translocase subunit SecE, partial [SAR86 cluster bacterium]|nr:preprotein translocase subunit SecE [SAR86 cluster bacterium]